MDTHGMHHATARGCLLWKESGGPDWTSPHGKTRAAAFCLSRLALRTESTGAREVVEGRCVLLHATLKKKHVVGLGAECGRSDWASIKSSMGMCLRLPPRH